MSRPSGPVLHSITLLAASLVALLLGVACADVHEADLVIHGATLIDGTGAEPREVAHILVRDGRITQILDRPSTTRATQVVDATGKYVIPGLADMHVHFSGGVPRQRRDNETDRVLALELYYGVTSILQLGGTDGSSDFIVNLRERRTAGELQAPFIYGTGGHLTLPGTHPIYTIFPPPIREAASAIVAATPLNEPANLYPLGIGISLVRTEQAARKAVRERAERGMNAIKITVESGPSTFGDDHPQMSVEMIRAIVDEAQKHKLRVFAHITSIDELEAVAEGGAAGAVHAVWDDPKPGEAFVAELADSGFIVLPTLSLYAGAIALRYTDPGIDLEDPFLRETFSNEDRETITNPRFVERLRASGAIRQEAGEDPAAALRRHLDSLFAHVKGLQESGVSLALGTDTGNPYVFPGYSVHRELELLVEAGLSEAEALAAATRNAAAMIGQSEEFGTVEVGMRADLLVLAANPLVDIRNTRSLETVITEGRVVDRQSLRESL